MSFQTDAESRALVANKNEPLRTQSDVAHQSERSKFEMSYFWITLFCLQFLHEVSRLIPGLFWILSNACYGRTFWWIRFCILYYSMTLNKLLKWNSQYDPELLKWNSNVMTQMIYRLWLPSVAYRIEDLVSSSVHGIYNTLNTDKSWASFESFGWLNLV